MNITLTKSTYRAGSPHAGTFQDHVAPESAPPVLTAASYTGTPVPSDNGAGGVFTLVPGFTDKWTYVPANKTQDIIISVTDGVPETDTLPLSVKATFPFNPHFGYDFDTPTLSRVITAKDNTPKFRRMPKQTAVWNCFFLNRTILEVSLARAFFQWHDIDKEFYFVDPELVQTVLVRFDSSIRKKVNGANNFELSCIFKIYQLASMTIPEAYV